MSDLISAIRLKGKEIRNRIVMPPMVCFGWAGEDGKVTQKHIDHYEERAKGGCGLIIIEATCIQKDGRLADSQLGIWADGHVEGLSRIARACHRWGARVLIQIHHAGLKTPASAALCAWAPSDYADEKSEARELSLEAIQEIQNNFAAGAKRALMAGMDGVELHGAHGYLIDQFMSPLINKRQDGYGGDLWGRTRFAREIIQRIKDECGESFILGYRMGGNEPTLKEGVEIAQILEKAGVDLLHVSAGMDGGTAPQLPEGFPYNWIVYCGSEIRKSVGVPVIVVNGIRTPEQARYLVSQDMADLVAVGKGHLVDPHWAHKAETGEPVVGCLNCPRCQWFTDGLKCPGKKQGASLSAF